MPVEKEKNLARGGNQAVRQHLQSAASETEGLSATAPEPLVRDFTIRICQQCYELVGAMCHNPECVFCRRTMAEVGEYLDVLLIRPLVDGERLDLHPVVVEERDDIQEKSS